MLISYLFAVYLSVASPDLVIVCAYPGPGNGVMVCAQLPESACKALGGGPSRCALPPG